MADPATLISAIIGSAPTDLVDYYVAGDFPSFPDSRIRCLSLSESGEYNQQMRGIPLVDRLGLWVLDDANDSNPYAYVSSGPCRGMILHLHHDDDSAIAFSSLQTFVGSLRDTGAQGGDIDDIVNDSVRLDLDETIRSLGAEGTDEATALLTVYLPVSADLRPETATNLVSHQDFFVREAFANHLAGHPSATAKAFVEQLEMDKVSQVASAAKRALEAIRRALGSHSE